VNSAVIANELPAANQITAEYLPQELVQVQQIPFQAVPSPGMTLQSGAVHYFAPEDERIADLDKILKGSEILPKLKYTFLTLLKKGVKIFGKVAIATVVAFAVASLAVAFTAVVCKHTSLCVFKLHQIQFDRDQFEVVRSLASDEKVKTLTKFVMDAFEQYDENPKEK